MQWTAEASIQSRYELSCCKSHSGPDLLLANALAKVCLQRKSALELHWSIDCCDGSCGDKSTWAHDGRVSAVLIAAITCSAPQRESLILKLLEHPTAKVLGLPAHEKCQGTAAAGAQINLNLSF